MHRRLPRLAEAQTFNTVRCSARANMQEFVSRYARMNEQRVVANLWQGTDNFSRERYNVVSVKPSHALGCFLHAIP